MTHTLVRVALWNSRTLLMATRRWNWFAIGVIALLLPAAAGAAGAQTCAGMSLGTNASLNGFVPFPAQNVWNTNIADAPVDPDSPAITSASGFAGLALHPDFGSEPNFGMYYLVVDSTQTPAVPVNVLDYADQSDVLVAPYPDNAPIEGSPAECAGWPDQGGANNAVSDQHMLVLDRAKCVLYETWNTNHCNGLWDASSMTLWDLKNYEARPYGWTSADAAGLPIFPALVRYDEVASGAIHHALRFTMRSTKDNANDGYFVAPATHAAGNIWGVSNIMGMRIRLKASYDISGFSPTNQVILTAMKQYGMILADNGGYFFFQGASDPRWDDNDLDNLKTVGSENFEVIQMNPAYPGYDVTTAPTGATPVIASFTASATSVSSGSPVTFSYQVSGDSYDYIDVIGPVRAGSGSVTVSPTFTRTYTLVSSNAYGRSTSQPITVTVPGSVVAAPVFTPVAGSYSTTQTVTVSTSTSLAAAIHYTTNGTTPTVSSPSLNSSDSISVSSSETIKAIAVVNGYASPSAVSTAVYTIAPLADAPVFSLAPGAYSGVHTLTLSSATPGAMIYYTTDGSTAATSATAVKYSTAITVSKTETINAVTKASGYTPSVQTSATYTIMAPPAAAPTFSPAAGTYTGSVTVTLRSSTPNAEFAYTTDGSNPVTSATRIFYSGPIKVSKSETIIAFADAPGVTANSANATATYTIIIPAASPTFSPAAGSYKAAQTVTIKSATSGATIYYTTNGTNPATSATAIKYSAPVAVSKTETLEAVAKATGYANSVVATAAYTIVAPSAAAPTFSPAAGTYTGTQTVTIRSATANASICYTTDGSNPLTSSTRLNYTAPVSVTKSETLNAFADTPGVTQNSAVATAAYVIKPPAAATPTFSPAAGTYTAAQTVTIKTAISSATIYYTTDGTNPATSATAIKYSAPVTVSKTETLEAVAKATGYANSAVVTAAYAVTLAKK